MLHDLRAHVRTLSEPFASALDLERLPEHADVAVLSLVFFGTRKSRHRWDIHVVSFVHAIIIITLATRALYSPALEVDRVFGWDERAGVTQAVACGYFLWDFIDSLVIFDDLGFVLHGFACLSIYLLCFKPFLAYYGVRFLLWELSTIFLDIHWFLDKAQMTGSRLQLINGFALLFTFFSVRLVWGGKLSYEFFLTLYGFRNEVPMRYIIVYGLGNIVLQSLNWFWFSKMIQALRKRFQSPPPQASTTAVDAKLDKFTS